MAVLNRPLQEFYRKNLQNSGSEKLRCRIKTQFCHIQVQFYKTRDKGRRERKEERLDPAKMHLFSHPLGGGGGEGVHIPSFIFSSLISRSSSLSATGCKRSVFIAKCLIHPREREKKQRGSLAVLKEDEDWGTDGCTKVGKGLLGNSMHFVHNWDHQRGGRRRLLHLETITSEAELIYFHLHHKSLRNTQKNGRLPTFIHVAIYISS